MKIFAQTLFLSSVFWLILVLVQPLAAILKNPLAEHPWLGVVFLIPDPPYCLEPLWGWWPIGVGLMGLLLGSIIEAVVSVKAGKAIK